MFAQQRVHFVAPQNHGAENVRLFYLYGSPKEPWTTATEDRYTFETAFRHVIVYLGKKEVFISVSDENQDGKITHQIYWLFYHVGPSWLILTTKKKPNNMKPPK